jgi:hypothetical protein
MQESSSNGEVLKVLLSRSPSERDGREASTFDGPIHALRGRDVDHVIGSLIDREEVRDLVALYAHRTAHRGPLADLFTADGIYISRFPGQQPQEVHGRPAIDAFFKNYFSELGGAAGPQPMIHNLLIELSGDFGIGICSNEVRLTYAGKSTFGLGYYQDRYAREGGRWKFAERDMTFTTFVTAD